MLVEMLEMVGSGGEASMEALQMAYVKKLLSLKEVYDDLGYKIQDFVEDYKDKLPNDLLKELVYYFVETRKLFDEIIQDVGF